MFRVDVVADDDEDKESGIHVSDVEEMEIGVVEGNTPVEGQIPKGLPGMASSGRRGRTFSTGKEVNNVWAGWENFCSLKTK